MLHNLIERFAVAAVRGAGLTMTVMVLTGCGMMGGQPDHAATEYPAGTTTRYARALGYMDAGEDERALVELENFRERYPDYAGPLVNLGIIHGRNGRPDAAIAALRRAVSICTECAAAYNQMGIVQRQEGNFETAETAYLQAIKADPNYALAYYNLGVLYDLYQGRPDLALKYYRGYVERKPDSNGKDVVDKWIIDLQRRVGQSENADSPEASG